MRYTENCIPREEMAPPAGLKVIRRNDPHYGLSDEEIEDRIEFIRCYLLKDFEAVLSVPRQDYSDDFFVEDYQVTDDRYSAFNTVDFQSMKKPFNKYGYAMKKIMERAKDIAVMHSCISCPDDRKGVYEKFRNFVFREFGLQHETLAMQLHLEASTQERLKLKREIARLERRIRQCQRIWERYAPPESWDC
jgi:hypothetical protein